MAAAAADVLEDALEHLVRGIVVHPDDVRVASRMLRRGNVLEVRVHPDDLGKVIGRGGRTARALRTVIGSLAGNRHVRIDLLETGEVRLEVQVVVGRIGRPHGVRGDVVVAVRTDEPDARFAVGARLDTSPADTGPADAGPAGAGPAGVGPLTVTAVRWQSGELIVRFGGIADRDAASELRGVWLSVDSGTLGPLDDPDEFRDHDLIGLSVRTTDGTVAGVVTDVLHPGQDVLAIRPALLAPGSGSGEVLVPFVKAIVTEVDVAGGFLVIDPPPGLLNLDEAL